MFDPHSSSTAGYHLFLEPEGVLRQKLSTVIEQLAEEYGGPLFTPHVTLLARIASEEEALLVEKAKLLAEQIAPFSITLGNFGLEDAYFRALYVHAECEEIVRAHKSANQIFGTEDERAYIPHVSLLYGNYPYDRKQKTAQALSLPPGETFLVDRIHLYKTEGEVSEWIHIGEYSLTLPSK